MFISQQLSYIRISIFSWNLTKQITSQHKNYLSYHKLYNWTSLSMNIVDIFCLILETLILPCSHPSHTGLCLSYQFLLLQNKLLLLLRLYSCWWCSLSIPMKNGFKNSFSSVSGNSFWNQKVYSNWILVINLQVTMDWEMAFSYWQVWSYLWWLKRFLLW